MEEKKKIRPQDKWNNKAGYISKSYKLHRDLTEMFAKTCEKNGTTQAAQLTKMMKEYIEESGTA